ncbi:MAG: hypothetical protein HQ481_00220 [Alphaproteobacteria bacterium]|nr:hypothetical protein [Alphaproteobacteria bacterium]
MRTRANVWIPDEPHLRVLLEEAADTLRRLPRAMAKPRLSSWPTVVRESMPLIAADTADGRGRLAPPTPGAIDRMDAVLFWLLVCDLEARRLVWARACCIPWRRLEDQDGRSHMTLRKVVNRGLDQIRRHLRANPSQLHGFRPRAEIG